MTKAQPSFKIMSLQEQPGLADAFWPVKQRIWPEFMFHDIYSEKYWHFLSEVFNRFQLYLLNDADEPIAVGQTIPCTWDGTMAGLPVGWAESLVRGATDYEAGRAPNTLVALEIAIHPEYRGQGVSYQMLHAIRHLAEQHSLQAVIVAVRPSLKSKYPLTPMERYVRWLREDGAPFDPWLRAHWRLGAEILKIAHPSMVIEASINEWEQWTAIKFPESGDYIIPGALVPIQIDHEMNLGRYIEPNVWVHHPLTTKPLIAK
jgi:GNAT superfamily N-acetyltransferase